MRLLCTVDEPNDSVIHVVDEMTGSGTVYAVCGWKSKSFWRVAFRDATNVKCDDCKTKALASSPTENGLLLNVPADRYDVLRVMLSGERALAVIVPAGLKPEDRKRAIAELDGIAQALRKLD